MNITAAQVNELRRKTGAGMMDCKNALIEANGDTQKAIEVLRKKGAAVAAKRAEKSANEGLIVTKVAEDKKSAAIVEINCETDFVANSTDFTDFAKLVALEVFKSKPGSVKDLLNNNSVVKNSLDEVLGKVGEKIVISRFVIEDAADGIVEDYIHPGSKLGVLVKFSNAGHINREVSVLARDIAMQIAAMSPICVNRENVPKETVEKEMEIYRELSRKEGKPENILDKIAQGRLNKFYQENVLVEQTFIKDNSKTVAELVKEFNTRHGTALKISLFHRFHLGDEKK
jgi:elongation factor Ts